MIIFSNGIRIMDFFTKDDVTYFTFPMFDELGVKHAFSTRLGGVSKGIYSSMNLSFHRNDKEEDVRENHRRFAKTIGYDENRLVFSDQVHDTVIKCVTEEDCGKGMIKESDIIGVDGLVTNKKNVPLITFFADCVPLFFYDDVEKVIALAHSGWKGTVKKIGAKMIKVMEEQYGCHPKNIYCGVGPSICKSCYEVDDVVVNEFKKSFHEEEYKKIVDSKGNGKYQLDLWKANEIILLNAGVSPKRLKVSNVCTCCNSEVFFSHRASHGKRGNLAAVMVL